MEVARTSDMRNHKYAYVFVSLKVVVSHFSFF